MASKIIVFLCCVICAICSEFRSIKVLQGPGSKTSLYGPDGSSLKSKAPGGTVVTDPDIPAGLVASGPAILPSSPEVIIGGGPIGKIVTSYTLAGPAVVPAVLPEAAVLSQPVAVASGPLAIFPLSLSGGGVDASEAFYDDGSYKEGIH